MSFTPTTQEWHAQLPLIPSPAAPPMTSPTSAPQLSKALPERKPKLRASCDACAASKVKCSKEHPICQRCATNGSPCIYGVSRKHGKPGRTRKRNPDGTPFIKASKQRPSPDGSEFGKFRVRAEPLLPDLPQLHSPVPSQFESWPSTPEWPGTPEYDYEMTPDPTFSTYSNSSYSNSEADFSFMDDILMVSPEDSMPAVQPELTFRDPFAKKESMQHEIPLPTDFEILKEFIGGQSVNPLDYALSEPSSTESYTPPESPKGSSSYFNHLQTSIEMPASHCCYSLAYATLESLKLSQQSVEAELKSLDSVLSVTKTAVSNVLQLLSCSCASDPHLAMLYSSITSKILTWYQIAAGVQPSNPSNTPLTPALPSPTSNFSSPLSTPSSQTSFKISLQPLKIGAFEFDEADQAALARQVVLRELKKCGALVEALANWRSDVNAEQAEFLYDVLGAWLKSELYKTLRQITGEVEE